VKDWQASRCRSGETSRQAIVDDDFNPCFRIQLTSCAGRLMNGLASGISPIAANRWAAYSHVIKARRKKKALTFGGFIAATYRACGKRRARGIVQLAVNAHLIEFRGRQHFVIT